ncbi:MAG TPA: FHA domain-containing serine/threonine-protein kinase [Gemmata sp.]|nr:FHA domain-containing serine/threonine-protein kinase [Gemmata sp.]
MAKKTILIDGSDREHFFLAVEEGTIRIGHKPNNTEGVARDLRITRIHCEVEVEDDRDNMAIDEPGVLSPRSLFPGKTVQLGHSHLLLVSTTPAIEKKAEQPTSTPISPEPAQTLEAGTSRWLKVVDGANQGRLFRLPGTGTMTVGRSGKHVDIGLDDLYVMRVQCSLEIAGDAINVSHIDGANGTFIDGQRVTQPQILKQGNVLRVGNSHLRLEAGTFPEEPPASAPEQSTKSEGSGVLRAASSSTKLSQKPKNDDPLAAFSGQEFGQFQIGKLLGRGQAGAVYSAANTKTGQEMALKLLAAEFPASNAELTRFVQELKAVQNIRHPNLVSQFSAGKVGVHCWIGRELVEGDSAESFIARIADGEKPSWTRAARVAIHLARALDCLHQHRLVHGNITPRNVLIRSSDHATKLADLHLAQGLEGSQLQQTIRERKRLAELPYCALEQAEPDGFVDRLADLYGVGSLAYALIAGRPPVSGKSIDEILNQIRTGWIPRPSSIYKKVPAAFDAVVMKLLAKHQEDRYQTAEALLEDLEAIAQMHEIKL